MRIKLSEYCIIDAKSLEIVPCWEPNSDTNGAPDDVYINVDGDCIGRVNLLHNKLDWAERCIITDALYNGMLDLGDLEKAGFIEMF